MKYPVKFTLISLILDIPSLILLGLLTTVRNEAIDFGEKEQLGLKYNEPVKEMLFHIVEHRQAALVYFEGTESEKNFAKARLQDLQEKIKRDVEAIDAADKELGDILEGKAKWAEIRKQWLSAKESLWRTTSEKTFDEHSAIIDKMVQLMVHIGDISNLVLDPDIDSYYMMDGVIFRIPALAQKIAQARDLSQRITLEKELGSDKLAELIFVLPGIVESTFDGIKVGVEKAYSFKNVYGAANVKTLINADYERAVEAVSKFLAQTKPIRSVALDSSFNAKQHVAASEAAIESMKKLYDVQAKSLNDIVTARISTFKTQKMITTIAVIAIWVLVIYLLIGFYRSVMKTAVSYTHLTLPTKA
jgi:methyl-accepting chemotaxis protein